MLDPPVVLSIAGSDCSAGAGIQADLKTFSYFETFGLTAITCVVAETPNQVSSIHPVPASILEDQLRLLFDTYPIAAIKIGMIYSEMHLAVVTKMLDQQKIPIIIDPVMVASSGTRLLKNDSIKAFTNNLLPMANLVTPNLAEASVLLNENINQLNQLDNAAREIGTSFNVSCLIKGGHLPSDNDRIDVLYHQDTIYQFTAPTIDIKSTHGTGCSLSAAITANLALGYSMYDAIKISKDWIHKAIAESFLFNSNNGATVLALNQIKHTITDKIK